VVLTVSRENGSELTRSSPYPDIHWPVVKQQFSDLTSGGAHTLVASFKCTVDHSVLCNVCLHRVEKTPQLMISAPFR